MHNDVIQAAVIREVAQGIIPQRRNMQGRMPCNHLPKSEQLVRVINGVD